MHPELENALKQLKLGLWTKTQGYTRAIVTFNPGAGSKTSSCYEKYQSIELPLQVRQDVTSFVWT